MSTEKGTGLSKLDWDDAIATAEDEIKTAKQRIAVLRRAIKGFRELKEKGMKFPSRPEEPTQN